VERARRSYDATLATRTATLYSDISRHEFDVRQARHKTQNQRGQKSKGGCLSVERRGVATQRASGANASMGKGAGGRGSSGKNEERNNLAVFKYSIENRLFSLFKTEVPSNNHLTKHNSERCNFFYRLNAQNTRLLQAGKIKAVHIDDEKSAVHIENVIDDTNSQNRRWSSHEQEVRSKTFF